MEKGKKKEKCVGQHFFDLLNWSHVVIGEDDRKTGIVICRKCGDLRVVKITDDLNGYD